MKRALALITVLSIFLSVFAVVPAFAAGKDFMRVDVSESDKTYNVGDTINVVIKLADISLPDLSVSQGDGISAFTFFFNYDVEKVTPVIQATADKDGDLCNFFDLITSSPVNWEAIGKLDTATGCYDLAFSEMSGQYLATNKSTLVITIPFTVNEGVKVDDIVFNMNDIIAYNSTLLKSYSPADIDIVVSYALQPEENVTLPEEAIVIEAAGFANGKNFVYYATEDTTGADVVAQYASATDMSEYAIIIVDENGVVTDYNLITATEEGKLDTVIPAGSTIVGVHARSSEFSKFIELAIIDSTVEFYNINLEATSKDNTVYALFNAGMVITNPEPIPDPTLVVKEGCTVKYDEENALVKVYGDKIDIEDFKAMFENEITVLDKNGNVVTSGLVKTNMTIDFGDGVSVIVMGDVNSDGKINAMDYAMVKRHIIGTMVLTDNAYKAACVTGGSKPRATDYVTIKRHVIGTLNIVAYFK